MISAPAERRSTLSHPSGVFDPRRLDGGSLRFALVAVALGVVLFYVVAYPLRGIQWAAGWDTSFYVWWARRAQEFGLSAGGTGSRPATVGLLAALSSILHMPVAAVAAALGPALAASCGLALAALMDLSLPRDDTRGLLATALVAGFLSLMTLGYLATLLFLTLLVAAVACLRSARSENRWAVAAMVLLGASGLAHPVMVPLAMVVAAGAAVVVVIPIIRDGTRSWRWLRTEVARFGMVVAGAVGILLAGLLVARAGPGPVLDRAGDGAMRRLGLGHLVTSSYRDALLAYLPYVIPAILAAGLGGWLILTSHRSKAGGPGARTFWGAMAAWILVTTGAVVLLLTGFRAPGQRLAPICLALPGVAAIAIAGFATDRSWPKAARLIVLVPVLAIMLGTDWALWNAYVTGPPRSVVAVGSLGPALAAQPPGTPLVVIVDARGDRPAVPAIEVENAVRAVVPPGRVSDVHVFMGKPADFLAGRPTLTGLAQHDRLAVDYWEAMKPNLADGALAVVIRDLDPRSFDAVTRLPGRRALAAGVLSLPGYDGRDRATGEVAAEGRTALTDAGPGRLSPWLPVWLAPALLVLLILVGWPWARWMLPNGTATARLGLAPSFALAALALTAILVDATGLRLGSSGGVAACVLVVMAGTMAVSSWTRTARTPGPKSPPRSPSASSES